jgi:predicted dehydrogenase
VERVRIGLLGAGFVCNFYMEALRHVRDHEVVAVFSRREENARGFAEEWRIPTWTTSMEELVQLDDVDLVVVGVPHCAHVEAVSLAAEAGRAVVCTKPLGRSAEEARQCLRAVEQAGVWHGYAETEVFSPVMQRAKALADSGSLGKVYWVRFREAHSQLHAFAKDPELNGGGPLRGLGCHGVAIGRHFLDGVPEEVFAWGDTIARDDVASEDSALMMMRFPNGTVAQIEVAWAHKAGLDTRTEIHGNQGYISTDVTGSTGMRVFAEKPVGYVLEKAGLDRGWMTPVPDEAIRYGYHAQMDHFVHRFLQGEPPAQTLQDGVIDNACIDAAYRSMESGTWEEVVTGLQGAVCSPPTWRSLPWRQI